MCKETKNTSTGAVRSCTAKTAGSSRRRASGLRQDVGRARLARPACGSLSLGRGEQLLQQAWTRPALGAPAAHDLHQALPFPSHPVSERLFSLAAKPEACRAQRKAGGESQHRAPVRRGAGGPLVRRSPEECAAWELLLEDPCLSPRS